MNNLIKRICFALFLFGSVSVFSETEYKTFGQLSKAESREINASRAEYRACLNEFAISQLEKQKDVRVIADHSMKHCAPVLEALYHHLVASNFSPDASKKFIRGISHRAVNKLLPRLMRFMAIRNSPS